MPALKGLFAAKTDDTPEDSLIAASGVVRLNLANPANVATYAEAGSQHRLSKEMLQLLRKDVDDFQELKWHYNEEALGADHGAFNDTASQRSMYSGTGSASIMQSASSANPGSLSFFNVQRLLVQEKGEDIYYHLASQKR